MENSKDIQEKFKGYCIFLIETMGGHKDECQNPFDLAVLGNTFDAIPRGWVKMVVDLLKKYGHIAPCSHEVDQYKISKACRKSIETKDWRLLDTMVLEFAEPYLNREKVSKELELLRLNLKWFYTLVIISVGSLIISLIALLQNSCP